MTDDPLLAVVDEIGARSAAFFPESPLTVNEKDLRASVEHALEGSPTSDPDALAEAIRRAWDGRGVRYECGDEPSDPVAQEMLRGVRDLARPELTGGVGSPGTTDVAALLDAEYRAVVDGSGTVRAYVRERGTRPLLLLSALGLPLQIWSRFLAGDHDHRIVVPVLPACDLLAGRMTATASAGELADGLRTLLDDLALGEVDVLAWCNGGRIGVELLRMAGSSITTLVLLSPTFRGGATPSGRTSPWENNLEKLFSMVAKVPGRAAPISKMLRLPQPEPTWSALLDQPAERATQLFGMPRRAFADAMTEPMATPESLVHYIARTQLDEAISGAAPTPLPGERVVLVQGSHDSVVDNVHTREWLEPRAPGFTCYEVSGAGHYLHDLQYPYLVDLLHRVLGAGTRTGALPARVREISGEDA